MSTSTRPTAKQHTGDNAAYAYEQRGDGWVIFAGVMLAIVGALKLIDGIAAVGDSTFFVNDAKFIFSNLNTWGWVMIVLGAAQIAVAFGVWNRTKGVRWIAVAIAGLNAIAHMFSIQAYPFWSLAVFTLDILIIYGLVAYGARRL